MTVNQDLLTACNLAKLVQCLSSMASNLKAARLARGWSQSRLVREIDVYANRRALSIAGPASLKVYVSEWENDRRRVAPEYAAILRALLGWTDDELFRPEIDASMPSADGYDELVSRIESAHGLSVTVVATLESQTELFRTMDRQMGATGLVDQMQAHLKTLQDGLTFAVLPDARRPVARALAGAASLAAWQALDVGAADRAWKHYELAKYAAQQADETAFLAHSMGEQSYVLVDAGRNDLALQLIREAQQVGGTRIPARLSAWLLATEAELLAISGEVNESRRLLDRAAVALPTGPESRDPEIPSVFLNETHLARWRGHSLALLGEDDAVTELYDVLAAMDPTFTRAQAGLRCDLAQAHSVRGETDQAIQHLREARLIANRTGSSRYRRRIQRITDAL